MSMERKPCHSETVLFIGAGASSKLNMPTTDEQADILYKLCEKERASEELIKARCFKNCKKDVVDLLNLLDYPGEDLGHFTDEQKSIMASSFPDATPEEATARAVSLRRSFDWPALKHVARLLKGRQPSEDGKLPDDYLQKVYDLMDVLLRENRGLTMLDTEEKECFLSPERLRGGRECLIYLMNIMFACAWRELAGTTEGQDALQPYRQFADALAELMQDEAGNLEAIPLDAPWYYLFSYSVLTTNFEPIFLWLIYQAHRKANRDSPVRVGNPGKKLQLMLDFPNTLAMRPLSDREHPEEGELDNGLWYPVTSAVAQRVNDEKHQSDRVVRIGKYYFVHGSCNFRHCPRCGRLSLNLGDSWDENSPTLFPPGPTKAFSWGIKARTEAEEEAHRRGEYDAMECLFCGQMTHAQDNFMHVQTHFKGQSPSFIKEITDEALASLTSVRHVVLLGYRFPPDDTIWTSNFIAMLNQHRGQEAYCSVICGYDGSDDWKYGADLEAHLSRYSFGKNGDPHGIEPILNAINLFGKEHVRAYTGGIPQVFHHGDKDWIREMLYPSTGPWKSKIQEFTPYGVVRSDL